MTDTPTIEELQSQLLELKQQNEEQKTKIAGLEQKNKEDEATIKSVREINTKLFQQTTFGTGNKEPDEPDEHPETMDEFCKSFINPAKATLEERFGVKFK